MFFYGSANPGDVQLCTHLCNLYVVYRFIDLQRLYIYSTIIQIFLETFFGKERIKKLFINVLHFYYNYIMCNSEYGETSLLSWHSQELDMPRKVSNITNLGNAHHITESISICQIR